MDRLMLDQLDRALAAAGSGNAEVVRDLETAFARFTGATYGLCVSSGTAALISALRAVGVHAGDPVAVSVLGPSMTGLAITALGASPVMLDCASPVSFGVSAAAARRAIKDRIKAVVLVPMWGYWDEDPATLDVFHATGVPVVVDAAQAPFLRLEPALYGVAAVVCLSLHGRKPLKAGEGGICLTRDAELAERMMALRNFGQATQFSGSRLDPVGPFGARFGVNLKINALGAAWCLTQLSNADHVRDRLRRLRRSAVQAFDSSQVPWQEAHQATEVREHGRYGLVALCRTPGDAKRMAQAITDTGVEVDTSRYRYGPMWTAPYLARRATAPGCPNAEQLTATAVACRLEAFASHTTREGDT
jgi:dTDP-4-amino-4,6-dideoxygalactose transaminase